MILTFLLPLDVWPRTSFSATYSLESWSATDPVGEVAPMGVPVIVAALLMSGIVVLAFLGILYGNLRSSISLVKLAVLAMAAFVLNVVSFVVAALVSIVVFFSIKSVFVAMTAPVSIVVSFVVAALASIVGSFVVTSVVVATAAPVSIVVSFVAAALVSIVESFSVKSAVAFVVANGGALAAAALAAAALAAVAAAGDDCFCRFFGIAVAAASLAAAGDAVTASAAEAAASSAAAAAGDDCFCRFFGVLFFANVNTVEAQKMWWLLMLSDDVWCGVVKNICSEFS